MDAFVKDRLCGIAVGAAVGDALGMPLEFGPRMPLHDLVREMRPGRLQAGNFTDDTEMALALADSLRGKRRLDGADLARHFAAWYAHAPSDVGNQTRAMLRKIAGGTPWEVAAQASDPDSSGNGSVMRCWPVAIACHNDLLELIRASVLQSRVTHPSGECVAACVFLNLAMHHLVLGAEREGAVRRALEETAVTALPVGLRAAIEGAAGVARDGLKNGGWVRDTVQSAVWGLLTTDSFEEAVVQVVNLGNDADTAGAVTGALAGAAYGQKSIPDRWRQAVHGEWPLGSGVQWDDRRLSATALALAGAEAG